MGKYENLVFEGGGVKGIAYGGALQELDTRGILSDIRQVAGTSAGAITAALLAVGLDTSAITVLIANTPFKKFKDDSFLITADIKRLSDDYGYYKGDFFKDWLDKEIEKQTGKKNYTFGNLVEDVTAKKKNYRNLYVVATNLSRNKHQIFSHETFPTLPISQAVRMSMSIPLFFEVVRFNGDIFVDGGLTYNYPIDLFDKDKVANPKTLGLRLDSNQEIARAREKNSLSIEDNSQKIKNIKDFTLAIGNYLFEMANSTHLNDNDYKRTIMIDTLGIGTTDFDISEEDKKRLMDSGSEGVREYFEWLGKKAK